MNYTRAEVFKHDGASIIPGNSWEFTFNIARQKDVAGRTNIPDLGIALSGAVAVLGEVGVNLNDFVDAAQPPMQPDEVDQLKHGYMVGNISLGNPIGEHMPEIGARQ